MKNEQEIELKFRLYEKEFSKIKEKISKIAKFVKNISHKDQYISPPHKDFLKPKYPYEWLRIGERGGKTILNYKHFYPEEVEVHTHCDELEFEGDAEQLRKLFSALNFKTNIIIEKQRETYNYDDEFEIAFDKVKKLGHFIEIEALKHAENVEKTREKLFEFAKFLGIDIENSDNRGYPYLMMKLRKMIK
ncbi:class IV adenylate cyclase [Candidatus Woesearchaeota archaeon]|nr:class IV adenylate cyclase [Candidatus Woesearchaeota archaeon]